MPTSLVPSPPNFCFCGHDYAAHNTTTCLECNQHAGNNHPFDSEMDMSRTSTTSDRPVGYYQSGGGTVIFDTTINFTGGYAAGVSSMVVTTAPTYWRQGDTVNLDTGTVEETVVLLKVAGTTITFMAPTINAHANGTIVQFQGPQSSFPGAACPANGQRAG